MLAALLLPVALLAAWSPASPRPIDRLTTSQIAPALLASGAAAAAVGYSGMLVVDPEGPSCGVARGRTFCTQSYVADVTGLRPVAVGAWSSRTAAKAKAFLVIAVADPSNSLAKVVTFTGTELVMETPGSSSQTGSDTATTWRVVGNNVVAGTCARAASAANRAALISCARVLARAQALRF
ncbi:MAG: hypothetical protein ACYC0W_06835 [Candidatus Nanopelagicales bacterium]